MQVDALGAIALLLILVSVLATTLVVSWIVQRRRERAEMKRERRIPLFLVSDDDPTSVRPPMRREAPVEPPPLFVPQAVVRPTPTPPTSVPAASSVPRATPTGAHVGEPGRYSPRSVPALALPGGGEAVEGQSLRFFRPTDGTLRFLPGRLEVIEGGDDGQEIRFVAGGPEGDQVTFGRADGPPYRHIQLRQATVSRLHARMELHGGAWHLANLSQTNPVVLNGAPLDAEESAVRLSDGDRIEMGEVVFRFHVR